MQDEPRAPTAAEDFERLEALLEAKLSGSLTAKISTVQMARALGISPEDSCRQYEAYNRHADRLYCLTIEWCVPGNPFHRRLLAQRLGVVRLRTSPDEH